MTLNTPRKETAFRPVATTAIERASAPTTCECCGREELVKTVKVTDGATTIWVGTGCAARICGRSERDFGKMLRAEQEDHDRRVLQAEQAAHHAKLARWQEHLDRRCPEHRGDVFRQVQALGGMKAAREDFAG